MRRLTRRKNQQQATHPSQVQEAQLTPHAEKVAVSGEAAKLAARLERLKYEAGVIPRG